MEFVGVREGKTTVLVPKQDDTTQFPPGTAPVFYNRRMELNRDITVLLLPLLAPSDYLDAMGATGIRGIRVAAECGIPVTIADREPGAVDLIRRNVERSGLDIEVVERDMNALLSERSFDAVDLDPFGTPAWVIDAAVRGCRRFLFVTATDTAPLCGAHLRAGIRRYGAVPKNTEYHSEVGLRILLGFVVRETVKYDRGIEPVFCYAREHFVRLHLRILRGAKAADETLARMGYIHQCPGCPYREEQPGLLADARKCPHCGRALEPVGPLWLGSLQRDGITEELRGQLGDAELRTVKDIEKLLDTCRDEVPAATFYDYHVLAKTLGCSPPEITRVLERIRTAGYAASRTRFSGYGIKTAAPLQVVLDAVSAPQ